MSARIGNAPLFQRHDKRGLKESEHVGYSRPNRIPVSANCKRFTGYPFKPVRCAVSKCNRNLMFLPQLCKLGMREVTEPHIYVIVEPECDHAPLGIIDLDV